MFDNCGIVSNTVQTVLELDFAAFDRLFTINVSGMAACLKHAARAMVELNVIGNIVCMTCTGTSFGKERNTDYYTSKHAMLGLAR
ncbi:hypothetical protein Godav_007879 [Gossypium davidsonii]|uniref:Short-chain dehydrogenase/reductase SDR n=1 Tax=Gossypium davidsonii TaxID=34287 RepID=A0A7J8S890_GOSDV|nr:hypothetical protein [Gossypium davidsonii]